MQRKTFTKDIKRAIVHELQAGKTVAQVCREYEIKPDMAYRWRNEFEKDPVHAFAGRGHAVTLEARNAELERVVGQLYLENDFLKKVQKALQQQLAESKKDR